MKLLKIILISAAVSLLSLTNLIAAPVLYFSAEGNDGAGDELWSYDGTAAVRVSDIYGGASGSAPQYMTIYDNKLFFQANDGTAGQELWSFNGTSVERAADINPGVTGSGPQYMSVIDNKLYFSAYDGAAGFELWSYDGVSAARVADIRSGASSSNPKYLTAYDNKLFFHANDGTTGIELWSYDGAVAARAADIYPGASGSQPEYLAVFADKLFFSANADAAGRELWSYDGTSAVRAADIYVGTSSSSPEHLTVFGDKLYFAAYTAATGFELWSYDGASAAIVSDINSGIGGSGPRDLLVMGDRLYFSAYDGTVGGFEQLWSYDGTSTRREIEDVSADWLAAFDGKLYFSGYDAVTERYQLWSYDGVSGDCLTDIFGEYQGGSGPRYLTVYDPVAGDDGKVYDILSGNMDFLGLSYSVDQLDLLSALYREGKEGGSPSALTVGDVVWSFIAGDLPGQDGHVIGDAWELDGKYYYYLGSGLEGEPLSGGSDVPEPSTLLLLLPFIGFGLKKMRGKKA